MKYEVVSQILLQGSEVIQRLNIITKYLTKPGHVSSVERVNGMLINNYAVARDAGKKLSYMRKRELLRYN